MFFTNIQNIVLSQIPFLSELMKNYGTVVKIGFAIILIIVFGFTAKLFTKEILRRKNPDTTNS